MTSSIEHPADSLPDNAIAIVGMAGRFPGADSVLTFWHNLARGEESIVTLSEDELVAAGVSEQALMNHSYVRRAALLSGIDEFDAEFFGFTPQVAQMLDPQHRLFLQCAWHALEDAGYDPARIDTAVGVYGTSSASGYLLHNLMSHHDPNAIIGQGATFEMVNLSLQNDKDHLATRVAHQLNLRGPALSVQTACSSSLVAVHLACQSILSGECEMALAGGSSVRVPHRVGYWAAPGSMVSASGHCRPFDVRADGTVFGSGVGVVLLKGLAAALEDGDRIHAVIRGSAVNNDGSAKMTYAAPNAAGQAEVIAEAHAVADVDASTVGYVETHGTGTPLGDPIEIEGLRQAFDTSTAARSGRCVLGSVKSNIGHLEAAAGMAGLIKAILCLEHQAIPATLHYTSPNPELHLDRGPFEVRGEYGRWDCDGVRRAGVSSFGVGGTNAHIVLQEAPAVAAPSVRPGPQVLVLSARTVEALGESRRVLAAEFDDAAEPNLADVAFTLGRRRTENIRMAAVAGDGRQAAAVLAAAEHDNIFVGESAPAGESGGERVVFLFPGQGAQHVGMARGLYESEPLFAEYFDQCATGFDKELGIDLRAEVFDGTARNLERTDRAQPALFAVGYALAKLTESYGVRPAALAGHSIGEYAAATIAGVFDLSTAVAVVSMRARLMHAAARGVMVAVALGPEAVAEYLSDDVDVAAVNDPGGCVVAGSEEAIRQFQGRLAGRGVVARRVRTSHAFHSRLMDPVAGEFGAFLSRCRLGEARIPLLSNVSGTWMSGAEAANPAVWARQVRATVRFADELGVLLADPHRVLVEVGPGGVLTASAARHPRWSSTHRGVRLMRHHAQNRSDHEVFLLGLGQLWAAGVEVDFTPRWSGGRRRLVSLPGYPFVRQRHWVEHRSTGGWAQPVAASGEVSGAVLAEVAGDAAGAAANGKSQIEATLAGVWAACLGVGSVRRDADFFELGGDSLVAISVAMAATHEGLDFTPQDLYENPTVAGLAKALTARYVAGGLARQSPNDAAHPPIPPNITYFLEHGIADGGRWRVPLILRLDAGVGVEDVRAVLSAVVNHHDGLRLRLARRAGAWEQHIGEPGESVELAVVALGEGVEPGSTREHAAVVEILGDQMRVQDLSSPPLVATYVRGVAGGPCYLALSVHAVMGDEGSREILLTDIFTGFGQRLAGQDIALQPVTTSWHEWSVRCAALAIHPAVVDSRGFWLATVAKSTLRVADPDEPGSPNADSLVRLPSVLSLSETSEIDDARRRLGLAIDEILLAALGRVVATTIGDGVLAVDVGGSGRSVLKPDVDLRRTMGWFSTIYPVAITCARSQDVGARQLLDDVRDSLKAVPHYGIGYGLLRYVYAPTARLLAAGAPADVFFSYVGAVPDLESVDCGDAAVMLDADAAVLAVAETVAGLGHGLEVRAYRAAGGLHVDWWYDSARVGASVVESLAEGFAGAVVELIAQAGAHAGGDDGGDELSLVDLSSVRA